MRKRTGKRRTDVLCDVARDEDLAGLAAEEDALGDAGVCTADPEDLEGRCLSAMRRESVMRTFRRDLVCFSQRGCALCLCLGFPPSCPFATLPPPLNELLTLGACPFALAWKKAGSATSTAEAHFALLDSRRTSVSSCGCCCFALNSWRDMACMSQ